MEINFIVNKNGFILEHHPSNLRRNISFSDWSSTELDREQCILKLPQWLKDLVYSFLMETNRNGLDRIEDIILGNKVFIQLNEADVDDLIIRSLKDFCASIFNARTVKITLNTKESENIALNDQKYFQSFEYLRKKYSQTRAPEFLIQSDIFNIKSLYK